MNKRTELRLKQIIKEELDGFLGEQSGHSQIKEQLHALVTLLKRIEDMADVSEFVDQSKIADKVDDLIKGLTGLSKTLRKGKSKKKKVAPVEKDEAALDSDSNGDPDAA